MGRPRGLGRVVGAGTGTKPMLLATALLFLGGTSAQSVLDSCVQVSDPSFDALCPCDAGSDFTFSIEGKTSVTANVVRQVVELYRVGSICGIFGRFRTPAALRIRPFTCSTVAGRVSPSKRINRCFPPRACASPRTLPKLFLLERHCGKVFGGGYGHSKQQRRN